MQETIKQVLYRTLNDIKFAKVICSLPLSNEYFPEDSLDIVKLIARHYREHNSPLSGSTLKIGAEKKLSNSNKLTPEAMNTYNVNIDDITQLSQGDNYENSSDIKQTTDAWTRKKMTYKVIVQAASGGDLENEKTINSLVDELGKVLEIGEDDDGLQTQDILGSVNKDAVKDIIKDSLKGSIPLGFKQLDDSMVGGLARKEMGMVVAKTGEGKTTFLLNLACNFVKMKKNVVFVELEENFDRLITKNLSMLGRFNQHDLFDDNNELDVDNYEKLMGMLNKYADSGRLGQLSVWKDDPYKLTLDIIDRKLRKYFDEKGFYPDLFILDYPDLMKNSFERTGLREELSAERLFHSLRSIARKYNMIVFTANQANRSAYGKTVVDADNIEGAKAKLNSVELAISMNTTGGEFEGGFTRMKIIKARNKSDNYPEDGVINLKYDKSTNRILEETKEEAGEHQKILDEMGTAIEGGQPKTTKTMSIERTQTEIDKMRNRIPK